MLKHLIIIAIAAFTTVTPANATNFTYHQLIKGMMGSTTSNGGTNNSGNPGGGSGGATPVDPSAIDTITLADYNNGYLPLGTLNNAYNFDMKTLASITGTAHTVSDLIWSISSGALPSGLALSTSGELTGVPDTVTSNNIQIKAETPNGSGSRIYTIVVNGVAMLQATKITTGSTFSCALGANGKVYCWGDNSSGQLGNDSGVGSLIPTVIAGLPSDITQLDAGDSYACAVSRSQGMMCWGSNWRGQLGTGNNTDSPTPIAVLNLAKDITAISTGIEHVCAISATQGLKCWGANGFGQLGINNTIHKNLPISPMNLPADITMVSASNYSTCAVSASQGMYCWGDNSYGHLGNGNTTDQLLPAQVMALTTDITKIATGSVHTCAITTSQGLKCWGGNNTGQVGDGTNTNRTIPVAVNGAPNDIISLEAGYLHTCFVSSSQGTKCWGNNAYGQLGDGTNISRDTPTPVLGATNINQISAGWYHTCATSNSGATQCWGYNTDGELGNNSTTTNYSPVATNKPIN